MTSKIARAAIWGAVGLVSLASVAGLAHTSIGRTLWATAAGGDTCPFGGKSSVSPEEHEASLRAEDARLRGPGTAAQRPALAFELASAGRESFTTWATAMGGHCYDRDHGYTVECADLAFSHVAANLGKTRGTLWAHFDTDDRLREVTAVSHVARASEASRVLGAVEEYLTSSVGPPHKRSGQTSAAYLERGTFAQGALEFRFSNYYAKISATNMGQHDGYSIFQRYRALED